MVCAKFQELSDTTAALRSIHTAVGAARQTHARSIRLNLRTAYAPSASAVTLSRGGVAQPRVSELERDDLVQRGLGLAQIAPWRVAVNLDASALFALTVLLAHKVIVVDVHVQ